MAKQSSDPFAKRIAIEIIGWILVLLGIAALVLPGPGLLALFAGLALLSSRYEWAERRLEPVKMAAIKAATEGVATWPRIIASFGGVAILITIGIIWGLQPTVPGWWPFSDGLWLPGGWTTGASIIVSAHIAAAMIIYSYFNFRKK